MLNVALWSLAAVAATREHALVPLGTDAAGYTQLSLSAVYVAGCAYRSFLPVIDIPRVVLIDSRLSSVLVGRSVATVAELCFAAQWALVLHRAAVLSGTPIAQAMSLAIVPLIALAEGCSWFAVLTTEQRAHALENSLWGLSAAVVVAGIWVIGPRGPAALYAPTIAGGILYVAFIVVYDVPMYWARWRADQVARHKYLSIVDGFIEISGHWTVSCRWQDWRSEVAWMSLYFTFGVWSSIWVAHVSLGLGHGN